LSRKTIYFHHSMLIFGILLVLLVVVVGLIFFGALSIAFRDVGFSPFAIFLVLAGTLIGSFINIPLFKLRSRTSMVREEYVNSFGLTYRVPRLEYGQTTTTLAINVGGALIPTAVSVYLLARSAASIILLGLLAVLVVAIVTHAVARPVKGVGVTTPVFISPIAAAIIAVILSPAHPVTIAYVGGVLGTLIGADLSNLRKIPDLGAPMASIGGAGTFDGVFLSGIIAVLLAGL